MASRINIKPDARILVVDLAFIGDLLMSTPAFTNIRKGYPDAAIDLLVSPSSHPVIEHNIIFNEILTAHYKRKGWVAVKKEASRMAERGYDLAICFHRAHGSLLMLMLSGIRNRIGFTHGGRWIFTTAGVPFQISRHRAWNHLNLLDKTLPIEIDFNTPTSLELDPDAILAVEVMLENLQPRGPWAGINPNASWHTKRWTPEGYAAVGDFLADRGLTPILIGSPYEKPLCDHVASLMKSKPINLTGETTLPELAALLSKIEVLVTNDSGPMHMAQAVGTRVVSIFGPTDPLRCGPWLNTFNPVQINLDCIKCYRKSCEHLKCMCELSVEEVLETVADCISFPQKHH